MARIVSGRKGAVKKAARGRTASKRKAPAIVKKKAAATSVRKGVVKKAASKKAASKKPASKKAVGRVSASRRQPTRRTRAVTPVRRKAAAPRLKSATPAQNFTVSHLNESDFKKDGLRPYAMYRDLGIAAATNGQCQAHVIRLLSPCTDGVRQRHLHETELQLIYVLKGWVKNEFEGHGVQMMSAGTCWLQPPGIKHTVLDYSADAELLEVIVPADFKTVELT